METHRERAVRWITEAGKTVVVRQIDDEPPVITLNGFAGQPDRFCSAAHAQELSEALEAAAHTALTWGEESTDGSWSFCYVPPTAGEGAP